MWQNISYVWSETASLRSGQSFLFCFNHMEQNYHFSNIAHQRGFDRTYSIHGLCLIWDSLSFFVTDCQSCVFFACYQFRQFCSVEFHDVILFLVLSGGILTFSFCWSRALRLKSSRSWPCLERVYMLCRTNIFRRFRSRVVTVSVALFLQNLIGIVTLSFRGVTIYVSTRHVLKYKFGI